MASSHPDPITAFVAADGDLLERLNSDFEDAMVLVARSLGGHPRASSTKLVAIDRFGVRTTVTDPDGDHDVRVSFAQPLDQPEELGGALFDLVGRARDLTGAEGETTAEREAAQLAAVRTFVTEVVAVADVGPRLRQITFGGGDLVGFAPLGPDTFLYLLLPPPGRPDLAPDQTFSWEENGRSPAEEQVVGAYYTVRRWRDDASELDVLVVLHGDGHGHGHDAAPAATGTHARSAGHASAWAARAEPGDRIALWGPRAIYDPPPDTDRLVLIADETGLPAVAAIVEQRRPGIPVLVIAEIPSDGDRPELPLDPDVEVRWLHRAGAVAGTTTLLVDAVRSLPPFEGTPYVWGGAESHAMTEVRRHVRGERDLPRDRVALTGYWRSAAASQSDAGPSD